MEEEENHKEQQRNARANEVASANAKLALQRKLEEEKELLHRRFKNLKKTGHELREKELSVIDNFTCARARYGS